MYATFRHRQPGDDMDWYQEYLLPLVMMFSIGCVSGGLLSFIPAEFSPIFAIGLHGDSLLVLGSFSAVATAIWLRRIG